MRILIEVPTYDGRISQATSESLWRLDTGGHEVDYRPRTGTAARWLATASPPTRSTRATTS
jgi:hypothetical protein